MSIYYTEDHEWIKVEGDSAAIGISPYAANKGVKIRPVAVKITACFVNQRGNLDNIRLE